MWLGHPYWWSDHRHRHRHRHRAILRWISAASMRTGCSSTDIAKLLSTLASHSRTPFSSFDPIVALGALLVFGSFDKLDKVLVSLVEGIVDLVFCTAHSMMVQTLAFKAIVLYAGRTLIVIKLFVELEYRSAACSWTPSCGSIFFHKFVEGELLKLLFHFWAGILIDV